MKLSEIRELICLVDKSGLAEFEYETSDGDRLAMRKPGAPVRCDASPSVSAEIPSDQVADDTTLIDRVEPLAAGQFAVVAPMVGTFYRAPAPDADPFVEVGDIVEPGQTVCIVEAMKLMNEIEAERRGKVVRILVDNEDPVEYGQPLFVLQEA